MNTLPRQVYLDHAATTPTDPRVVDAMLPYLGEMYGNSHSAHKLGRDAEYAVEESRATIARILNCHSSEIVFTSGGTESDNLALRGAAWMSKHHGSGGHLVSSMVEHSAVLKTIEQLTELMGFENTLVRVDSFGSVSGEDFASALTDETAIASIIYANNEVGTISPISELARAARERGVLFHTDAVQAAGQLSLDVRALGVDMMSLSAHKFYGPKGIGLLYVRQGVELAPSQTGGNHEDNRRSGTVNTPAVVGMAKAIDLAYAEYEERIRHYQTMRDMLIDGILHHVPHSALTGHPSQRLPNLASFVFNEVDANMLVIHLDVNGVCASSASACKTGNPEPSSVLLAMGYSPELAGSSLRLSVGKDTTEEDVEYTVSTIIQVVEKMRHLQRLYS